RQHDDGQWNELRDVDYVTGAAFATRRDVLDAIGAFDEGFHPAYFEDADLCFRARNAGYRVVYVPSAVIVHYESATTVRDSYAYYQAYHKGRLRFVLKHYSAAQIVEDFYPAEMAWLAEVQSSPERQALRQAYQAAGRSIKGSLPALPVEVSRLLDLLAREAGRGYRQVAEKTPAPSVLGRLRALLDR
ncbi:MAG: glycosyltransferase, partial [Dehalococcoidia bacterium]|nr:glycosyltransferase [Dehalococcoidia bacterium]